ncbi:MAG: flagellar biosynthesis repressor FlbT [Rhodoblastus sp.]|nr:MAG: flagellar biosynthesis repressor FlbT [Rhodoblastus sp.]
MILSLRAGSKAYINGAVVKVDRRVNLHLLNDVSFLLDQHVLQLDDAKTPLRQVYFAVQAALIDPAQAASAQQMAGSILLRVMRAVATPAIAMELPGVARQIEQGRYFDAMKRLRALFPAEDELLAAHAEPAKENVA